MKIVTVVGARPQFIKAATLSRLIRGKPGLSEVLVHTGQHYDLNMSDIFFKELELPTPEYRLSIGSGPHGAMTGKMLEAVEPVLLKEKPDIVVVYGDTNSTLAGALAAAKLHIPIAHVESGLRSFNRKMPEEINRILTDRISEWLFCPTTTAVMNLKREGTPAAKVHLTGDVMYDASLYYAERAERESTILEQLRLEPRRYVLATIHRAENTDNADRLSTIIEGLSQVSQIEPVLLPLHPRTGAAASALGLRFPAGLRVIEPVGYLDMIQLERNARVIATDSGGVQKESFFFRVPCVTLRTETEWVETVKTGWNTLAPPDSPGKIAKAIRNARPSARKIPDKIYGGGRAAREILRLLNSADLHA